jgi:glucose-1-phosphate adenylyltransferase
MNDDVDLSKTVAVVLAGGQGTRLHDLTQREAKPALPFARFHRIVDFSMAGIVRSGIGQTVVATQYRPRALSEHVRTTWGPALPSGSLHVRDGADVAPELGYRGTADVLRANGTLLDQMGAGEVIILAADHIYSMDLRRLVAAHRASGAEVTLAAMPVPREEAGRFGIIMPGPGGRIAGFEEKPKRPASLPGEPDLSLASLGIYVADWGWLKGVLEDDRLQDFGTNVIPQAVTLGQAAVWRWSGYWRDVGTLDAFRDAWLDFEASPPPCQRPLVSGIALPPIASYLSRDRFLARANMGRMRLLQPLIGSTDADRWAALDGSILMPGARIEPGVRLTNVIVAPGATVPEGMRIGEDPDEDARWFRVAGNTTLVTASMLARRWVRRPRRSLALSKVQSFFHNRQRT